ncbi:MAG: GNAT family N-acetyltransferase [Luteolibacter sp.]
MTFREIPFGSDDYRQAVDLRFDVLRRQLAPGAADDDCDAEANYLHFGLFDESTLLACCFVVPMENQQARLRQMAVRADRQKTGLGRELMRQVEATLAELAYQRIILHAREVATGFYTRIGYIVTSDKFLEVGLPHFRMEKTLSRRTV